MIRFPVIASVLFMTIIASSGCTTQSTPSSQTTATLPYAVINTFTGDDVVVELEIPKTQEEMIQGLMNRSQLDYYSGMLFVFENDAAYSFWMKNTLIYLDVIYISSNGTIVHIRHNAEPLNETIYTPPVPCRYVLAVNGGFSMAEGVELGNHVDFTGV